MWSLNKYFNPTFHTLSSWNILTKYFCPTTCITLTKCTLKYSTVLTKPGDYLKLLKVYSQKYNKICNASVQLTVLGVALNWGAMSVERRCREMSIYYSRWVGRVSLTSQQTPRDPFPSGYVRFPSSATKQETSIIYHLLFVFDFLFVIFFNVFVFVFKTQMPLSINLSNSLIVIFQL